MKRTMLLLLFCGSLFAGVLGCGDDGDRASITKPSCSPAPVDTTDSDDD